MFKSAGATYVLTQLFRRSPQGWAFDAHFSEQARAQLLALILYAALRPQASLQDFAAFALYVNACASKVFPTIRQYRRAGVHFLLSVPPKLLLLQKLWAQHALELKNPRNYSSNFGGTAYTLELPGARNFTQPLYVHLFWRSREQIRFQVKLEAKLQATADFLARGKSLPASLQILVGRYFYRLPDGSWELNLSAYEASCALVGRRILVSNVIADPKEAFAIYFELQEAEKAFNEPGNSNPLRSDTFCRVDDFPLLPVLAASMRLLWRRQLDKLKANFVLWRYENDRSLLELLDGLYAKTQEGKTYYDGLNDKLARLLTLLKIPLPKDATLSATPQESAQEDYLSNLPSWR